MSRLLTLAVLITSSSLISAAQADASDDTLRYFLNKSDLVVSATLTKQVDGFSFESGVEHYRCKFTVDQVVKGNAKPKQAIDVSVVRFELLPEDKLAGLKKGAKFILFLKGDAKKGWRTADFWFGIQPHYPQMVRGLTQVAKLIAHQKRWAPVHAARRLKGPAAINEWIRISSGDDDTITIAALSELGNYDNTDKVTKHLKQLMAGPNKLIALEAAIGTCYGGNWSGLDMLLAHVTSKDKALRTLAIAQLGSVQFIDHRKKIVPLYLATLQIEKDINVIECTIAALGTYRSPKVLETITPYLQHENMHIRTRAELVVKVMKQQLAK
jgi:hypothetical protein